MRDEISTKRLIAEASTLGIEEPLDAHAHALLAHFRLLYVWNSRFNLTAIRDPDEGLRRHLLEALVALRHVAEERDCGDHLVDLGSGNGYPALPIAICRPRLRVTLYELSGRKVDFLRAAARESGCLDRVEVRQERVAEIEALPETASLITLRAFPAPEHWILAALRRPGIRRVLAWLSSQVATDLSEPLRRLGAEAVIEELPTHPGSSLLVVTPHDAAGRENR